MSRRTSIYTESFSHSNPTPSACRIGPLLMSGIINGIVKGVQAGTLEEQAALSFQRIAEVMAAAGGSIDDIVKVNVTFADITQRALDESDAVCVEALDIFCALLGTAAANLAVTLGALGGIYIGGGIVPRLGAYFDNSRFRERFEDKGRFRDYVSGIPTYVITAEQATFMGASAILEAQLRTLENTPGSAILGQIRRARSELSPAELRVAEHVLAHPRTVLNQPIVEIARAAQVSQPTVIRFCRSLGCEGLSDFKLRLASGLTGTVPITHVQVTNDDSMVELGTKVLGNTASAILQVRSQLNREMIDRTIELLVGARRVEFCAVGQYGPRLGDVAFRAQREALEHAQSTLKKLAAQAHGEALTQLMTAWEQRTPDQVPSQSELGRAVAPAVRGNWVKALGSTPAKDAGEALLRLEIAAEVPTPAEHHDARRMYQLQLLTKRNDPGPGQTWAQDVGQVLAGAFDAAVEGVPFVERKVLARAGLTVSDIDLFEVNEAFAPVVLSWAADTGVDLSKVNVHGGAIALGHPLGGSGTRIMTTLVNAMEQRGARYGLQTMCEAVGLANATILERLG